MYSYFVCNLTMFRLAFLSIRHCAFPFLTFESNQYRTMQNVKMTQHDSPYYDERVIGGKTGFTNLAKRCLVTYSKVKNKTIITVVFKENSREETFTDTKKLLDYVNEVLAA